MKKETRNIKEEEREEEKGNKEHNTKNKQKKEKKRPSSWIGAIAGCEKMMKS